MSRGKMTRRGQIVACLIFLLALLLLFLLYRFFRGEREEGALALAAAAPEEAVERLREEASSPASDWPELPAKKEIKASFKIWSPLRGCHFLLCVGGLASPATGIVLSHERARDFLRRADQDSSNIEETREKLRRMLSTVACRLIFLEPVYVV